MNRILLIIAAFVAYTATSDAQIVSRDLKETANQYAGWSELKAGFELGHLSYGNDWAGDVYGTGFKGLGLGYAHAFSVSSSHPIYVRAGIDAQYLHYSKDHETVPENYYSKVTNKVNALSLLPSCDFGYLYSFSNGCGLFVYTGLKFRVNLWGVYKEESSDENGAWDYSNNVFDDADTDDNPASRVQLGWHVGVDGHVGKFLVGLGYGLDLTKCYSDRQEKSKLKLSGFNVKLGYIF